MLLKRFLVSKFSGLHRFWTKVFLFLSIFYPRAGQKILLATIVLTLAVVSMSTRAAVVLQYHHVSESTPASTSITPSLFKRHIDYLAEHEINIYHNT